MSDPEDNIDESDHSQDSQDDASDANSDSSGETNEDAGFLDVMAAEGSEEESSEESDHDDDDSSTLDEPDLQFPQFLKLPFELRRRIWELFCPELRLKPRVLDFDVAPTSKYRDSSWPATRQAWTVRDGRTLEDLTAATRKVLAVHKESRGMVLSVLTGELALDAGSGDALVRFNPDTDVVSVMGGFHVHDVGADDVFHMPGFAEKVKHIAIISLRRSREPLDTAVANMLEAFVNLETVFVVLPSSVFRGNSLIKWCTSGLVNHFFVETFEKGPYLGEDTESLYCWPDLRNHKDFANVHVQRPEFENFPTALCEHLTRRDLRPWPLVVWEQESQLLKYERLKQLGPDVGDESESEDDYGDGFLPPSSEGSVAEMDEYESDGIDDAEVLETYDSDGVLSSGEDEDVEARFSSPEGEVEAHFSSPEGEVTAHFSSPEGDADQPSPPVNRGRKRRVVVDSEDDSEGDEPVAKRVRTVQSSDDEGAEGAEEPVAKEEEDSDEDSDEDEEEEEEEESEEDSEEDRPKHLSLAERLLLHRKENPVEDEEDESSAPDESEDEEDDDDDGDGLVSAMAEDEDDDEDEVQQDDFYDLGD